ncbi:hypothetical protein ACFW7J_20050 [Streptomyces sp. NPDC059525]|uniref:hypothetical protein n=1 Tax=Streptomyces sp. NPDC059525 TaxID=3346857 RepID=UPI0036B95C40
MEWFERAEEAEQRQDWDTAITLVGSHAECYSVDHYAHNNHLWHMSLLARADRLEELAELALTDVHARRRLNRSLRDQGKEADLRTRAEDGDRDALYLLVRLLCETNRAEEARQAILDLGPENQHAHQILADFRSSPNSVVGL